MSVPLPQIDLATVCDADVPLFTYNGRTVDVKITSVYDGDTFTGCFFEAGELRKHKFRCMGYDSEEMRQPRAAPNRDEAKARAQADRQHFTDLVDAASHGTRVLACKLGEFDKYGRILVQVPADGTINREMVESGHGYAYDGGKKR